MTLSWFRSYLRNRTQHIRISSIESSDRSMNFGVPQVSFLGPLLFLLYINDLPEISNTFHSTLFADDTTLALSDDNYQSLVSKANKCLYEVYIWKSYTYDSV